jgi:hypothetical protein
MIHSDHYPTNQHALDQVQFEEVLALSPMVGDLHLKQGKHIAVQANAPSTVLPAPPSLDRDGGFGSNTFQIMRPQASQGIPYSVLLLVLLVLDKK